MGGSGEVGHPASSREADVILTPDQRLRVFVSSTLEELAAERAAARRAIEDLRLAPVMFELGARPHPPRTLYRSYLDQSHVFVGIYWQRYGWVAPGMEVSGLEDEYLLAGPKPELIYVKRPAPEREPRLEELLDRIRSSDGASYKPFSDADELERLLADDLAVLLTEAFLVPPARDHLRSPLRLPADTTSFVGRGADLERLGALLARDDVRLVTLTGSGGIGKTRLALRAATDVAATFEEGAAFVPLASVDDPEQVPVAIATAVGVRDVGGGSLRESLRRDLAERSLLLVVDNVEHLPSASDLFAELLTAAPRLKVLVTSRAALRVLAEHEYPVLPLEPGDSEQLFVARAAAACYGYAADGLDPEVVAAICARLEHVPLAIELAAARTRVLPPAAMLDRLDRRLDFLVAGARDLPDRQRTLRATIQWSYDLLDDGERRLFAALGAFAGGFSLAAVESVHPADGDADVLDLLASLVDKSLLSADPVAGEPRFRMLGMIREFARERLAESGEADRVAARHAEYYLARSRVLGQHASGSHRSSRLRLFGPDDDGEGDNLRLALGWLLRHGRLDDVADMGWELWVPAWVNGRIDDGQRLARAALAADGERSERSRARLLLLAGLFGLWRGEHAETLRLLGEATACGEALGDHEMVAWATAALAMAVGPFEGEERAEELALEAVTRTRRLGDRWAESAALNVLGWLYVAQERFDGHEEVLVETLAASIDCGDEMFAAMAEVNLAELRLHQGDDQAADALLASSVQRHRSMRSRYSVAYLLDAAARCAHHRGDAARAARLLGAADRARDAIGIVVWGSQVDRRAALVEAVGCAVGASAFAAERTVGTRLSYLDALDEVDAVPAASPPGG